MFSDGVSEALNASGEEFGDDRILECVQRNAQGDPTEVLDDSCTRCKAFAAGTVQSDDLTAVVVAAYRRRQRDAQPLLDCRQRLQQHVTDDLQASRAHLVERVAGGVPRRIVVRAVDDVDRRHAGLQEREVVVLDARRTSRGTRRSCFSRFAAAQMASVSHGVEADSRWIVQVAVANHVHQDQRAEARQRLARARRPAT